MSDKLEKCVCGNEANIYFGANGLVDKCMVKCSNKEPILCSCRTPTYSTQKEAADAWNVMMQALKSGWTSEVPTEDGMYLYLTVEGENFYVKKYGTSFELKTPCMARVHNSQVEISGESYILSDFNGLWHRINYPDPPKD